MDPLSVAASAIAIIQLTEELLKATRSTYNIIKGAPKEIAGLIDELVAFGVILENLKILSQNAQTARLQQNANNSGNTYSQSGHDLPMIRKMIDVNAPLNICYNEMLSFKVKLDKNQSRVKKSLKWPFQKDEVQSVISRLRKLKSILDTAISNDQL